VAVESLTFIGGVAVVSVLPRQDLTFKRARVHDP